MAKRRNPVFHGYYHTGPPRDFVGPGTKYLFGALDDVIYVISPRPPFGTPTLWNAVFLHFEGSNYCSNTTAVHYVTVFNLPFAKNVKLKRFRGPPSSWGPGTSCPCPPSRRPCYHILGSVAGAVHHQYFGKRRGTFRGVRRHNPRENFEI